MSVTTAKGGPGYVSPNYIINGGFDVWQRGTSFSNPANASYAADRFRIVYDGSGATRTISQQSKNGQDLEVIGFGDSPYFYRFAISSAGTETYNYLETKIEDTRTLANQIVTLSFWAKANSARTITVGFRQTFAGGQPDVFQDTSDHDLTTAWQRFTQTFTFPSVDGATYGAATSSLVGRWELGTGTFEFDIWGVQLEAGSVATPFKRHAPSLQGELAACQRYYFSVAPESSTGFMAVGFYGSATNVQGGVSFPVTMRANPTLISNSGTNYYVASTTAGDDGFDGPMTIGLPSTTGARISTSTGVSGTAGNAILLRKNSTAAVIAFEAEL